jgi:tetratricopeptide (TPR) repeat protein
MDRAWKLLFCFLSFSRIMAAQEADWESLNRKAERLQETRNYSEAEQTFQAAISKAEGVGPADLRLAASLDGLASLYQELGRYGESAAAYGRALSVWERARRPEDSNVANRETFLFQMRLNSWLSRFVLN